MGTYQQAPQQETSSEASYSTSSGGQTYAHVAGGYYGHTNQGLPVNPSQVGAAARPSQCPGE